jgi:hypothetical protein
LLQAAAEEAKEEAAEEAIDEPEPSGSQGIQGIVAKEVKNHLFFFLSYLSNPFFFGKAIKVISICNGI